MFLIILLIGCLTTLFFYSKILHSYWNKLGVKQTKPVPIFGDNLGFILKTESFSDVIQNIYNQFKGARYCGYYQFYIPTLMIRDPELIKQIAVKDFEHFLDHRPFISEEANPLWAKNLFSLRGQKWKDMRATLSPSFTSSKMKYMFTLISDSAETFVQYFLNHNEDTIKVEMKDIFTRFTNDVIATIAFGVKIDSLEEKTNEFYTMGKKMTDFSGWKKNLKFISYLLFPNLSKIFKINIFDNDVTSFFLNLIKENIKTREVQGIVRNDMIHLLMEAKKGVSKHDENYGLVDTGFSTVEESEIGKVKIKRDLTDEDIAAQAFVFFFGGFDSVSALMCFMAYELAVNQDIQDKLRIEIKKTLAQCNGKITYEALLKMNYLDMIVSETLRKWPNAVGVDRICTKPYTIVSKAEEENDLHLSRDSVLLIPIYAIHRDPENYPDPEKFDPERFNEENKKNIKPYTYLPFGVGPRNCIGSRFAILETKAVIFHILLNFKIVPIDKTIIPLKISRKTVSFTSEDGFWFGLKRIED